MNKLFKNIILVLLIGAFTFGTYGCKDSYKNQTENQLSESSINAGETIYPVKITDSYGKEVTLDKEPKKVISVAPNISEIIFDLGSGEKLVGRTNYCDYPQEVTSVESIGTMRTPDIEKIISLEPDIVIASTHFNEENSKKLEDAGITVISLYEENNVDGVYTMIETLGTALNKNDKAKEKIDEMKKL